MASTVDGGVNRRFILKVLHDFFNDFANSDGNDEFEHKKAPFLWLGLKWVSPPES